MDILLRAFAWSRHLTEQREASKSNCVRGLWIPKKTSDLSFLWSFPKEPPQGALSDVLLGILSRHTLSDSLPAWPNVMLMQSSDSVCGWLEFPPTSILLSSSILSSASCLAISVRVCLKYFSSYLLGPFKEVESRVLNPPTFLLSCPSQPIVTPTTLLLVCSTPTLWFLLIFYFRSLSPTCVSSLLRGLFYNESTKRITCPFHKI